MLARVSNVATRQHPRLSKVNASKRGGESHCVKRKNMTTPNAHRIWPALFHLRTPNRRRLACKYPTTPTTAPAGFNSWHVVCLGIVPLNELDDFLDRTLRQKPSVVFDRFFEHITEPFPFWWANHHANLGRLPDGLVGYDVVGLGIEELCRIQGLSLLGHYLHEGILDRPLNPAVLMYERWISIELNGT